MPVSVDPVSSAASTSLSRRIPSLDGARAISIALVVYSHLATTGTLPFKDRLWRIVPGNLGVRVFFVISGFLITSLLLSEFSAHKKISLRDFYVRRFFRIMPAYWFFLISVGVAIPYGIVSANNSDIAKAALYVSNYFIPQYSVGHTWSLAVEEQFYLLWPAAIVFTGWRKATIFAAAVLLIAPLFRLACLLGIWPNNPTYAFETVCDALAVGCLLAIFRERLWGNSIYRSVLESKVFFALPLLVIALLASQPPPLVWALVGVTSLNLVIAMALDRIMRRPGDLVGRLLNSRPLCAIGLLSYSIYLWQQLWLSPAHPSTFPINMIAITVCAVISYLCIEKPMLRVGKRALVRLKERT